MTTARRAASSRAAARRATSAAARRTAPPDAAAVLARLRALADADVLAGYPRFGIPAADALGIAMADVQRLAKELGSRHDLADALWRSGLYEARLLVAFVADPGRLTVAQIERWCGSFDNWGVVDTLCFKLLDRSPLAWARIDAWKDREPEFEKRAAFALLASVALHDRTAPDAPFVRALGWIEAAATDERNFVKKGVLWALRGVGNRNTALHGAALRTAQRLARSGDATARWIGRTAARELGKRAPRR
jgi:3-methyladenine DNA glycosylase AlkD